MPSPQDPTRSTNSAPAADDQAAAPRAIAGRLPYPEVLREFASMLGAQLAREHLAEARNATNTAHDQTD